MKPTDKAIFGMVSESPGRNASEPTGGLETEKLRRPSPLGWGEGSMAWRGLTDAACHSGGVVGTARWQGRLSSNWRNRPRPIEQSVEQGRPYNRRQRESG